MDDDEPCDFLREQICLLDEIRRALKVRIRWDNEQRSFRITSRDEIHGPSAIIQALEALRRMIQHATALTIMAPRLRIIEPPSPRLIRTQVELEFRHDSDSNGPSFVGFRWVGPKLVDADQALWQEQSDAAKRKNFVELEHNLTIGLHRLRSVADSMRFRLHFGRLELRERPRELETQYDYSKLCELLKTSTLKSYFNPAYES